jgi:hypothetical protein
MSPQEEMIMTAMEPRVVGIFVDKASPERWIVRDSQGDFWSIQPAENPWASREPYYPTAETALEPVPGHYKYVLGLPG